MYRLFIAGSKNPIIIKTITAINKYYIGLYGSQVSYYYVFNYIFLPIFSDINQKRKYSSINIEYYYYNGSNWILTEEIVGGNTDDWYYNTTDEIGNNFTQHRFEFPQILKPYIGQYWNTNLNDCPLNSNHF